MAQINKPDEYFNTVLYTGNGGTQSITGVEFQPDFIWNKQRNGTNSHYLFNAITGTGKFLKSNSTDAEGTNVDTVTSFDSDGFTLGNAAGNNGSGNTMVSWNWLANGAGSANTDGDIASTVSANTTSGFSIVSYTGNGSAGATVGHGLGAVPKMIIVKNRDNTPGWGVYHASLGNTKYLQLNATAAEATASTFWNNTTPTSLVFSIGTSGWMNNSGEDYVTYCFAEKQGFSKFGSYTGNGSTDGTFVYTGFKPAMVIIKRTSGADRWVISDNKRDPNNVVVGELNPNDSAVEDTSSTPFDFLSNGFKIRRTGNVFNGSGESYIYMAFAENPLVGTNNIPATAR
jgi:hypothetical protein